MPRNTTTTTHRHKLLLHPPCEKPLKESCPDILPPHLPFPSPSAVCPLPSFPLPSPALLFSLPAPPLLPFSPRGGGAPPPALQVLPPKAKPAEHTASAAIPSSSPSFSTLAGGTAGGQRVGVPLPPPPHVPSAFTPPPHVAPHVSPFFPAPAPLNLYALYFGVRYCVDSKLKFPPPSSPPHTPPLPLPPSLNCPSPLSPLPLTCYTLVCGTVWTVS